MTLFPKNDSFLVFREKIAKKSFPIDSESQYQTAITQASTESNGGTGGLPTLAKPENHEKVMFFWKSHIFCLRGKKHDFFPKNMTFLVFRKKSSQKIVCHRFWVSFPINNHPAVNRAQWQHRGAPNLSQPRSEYTYRWTRNNFTKTRTAKKFPKL